MSISQVRAHKDFRLEAEYHVNPTRITSQFALGVDVLSFVQYGTSEELNDESKGFPVLRLNEFDDDFISEPSKYCDQIDADEFEKLRLTKGDVLVCRTNGNPKFVGRSAVVLENTQIAFASYLFRVRPKPETLSAAALMTFLNSKYGRGEIERHSIRSNQVNFSPDRLNQIRIPHFDKDFVKAIDAAVEAAYALKNRAIKFASDAELTLLAELGLSGWSPPEPLTYQARASEVFAAKRFGAEYFMPSKKATWNRLASMSGLLISDHVEMPREVFVPKRENGITSVRNFDLTDALQIALTDDTPPISVEHVGSAKKFLRWGDVVVSRLRSYLREIAVVRCSPNPIPVGSSEFVVLRPLEGKLSADTLCVYLRSKPIQLILQWSQDGSNHPRFDEDLLPTLPVPKKVVEIAPKIDRKIQEALVARQKSRRLLDAAKRAVELSLEENQAAGMKVLRNAQKS